MSWYLGVWKKYAVFEGRARRKEYWMFLLFHFLVSVVLAMVDGVLGVFSKQAGMGLLTGLYALAAIVPCIALTVRRLHDTDRGGLWILMSFVPLVGGIVMLVFMLLEGTSGGNRFGPDPKG